MLNLFWFASSNRKIVETVRKTGLSCIKSRLVIHLWDTKFTLLSSLLNVARLGFEHGLVWLETDVEGEMESTRPCPNKIMCLKHFNLQMVVVFQNKTGPLIKSFFSYWGPLIVFVVEHLMCHIVRFNSLKKNRNWDFLFPGILHLILFSKLNSAVSLTCL